MPKTRTGTQSVPGNTDNTSGGESGSGSNPGTLDTTANGNIQTTENPQNGPKTPVRSSSLVIRTTETTTGSIEKPLPEHPNLDKVTGVMEDVAKEALREIAKRNRVEKLANKKLGRLAESIDQINFDMEKSTDIPTDVVITSIILRTSKETNAIEEDRQEFSKSTDTIEVCLDDLLAAGDQHASPSRVPQSPSQRASMGNFRPWIQYHQEVNNSLVTNFKQRIQHHLELLQTAKNKIQQKITSNSQNSSRSSSISRSSGRRNQVDYLRPPILPYLSSTLKKVENHMRKVNTWINSMYDSPEERGSFELFKNHINSTLDDEWNNKTTFFDDCHSIQEITDAINSQMEVLHPATSEELMQSSQL